MYENEFIENFKKQYIKFSDIEAEFKPLAEFACEVCMEKKKGVYLNYSGCALRTIRKEYCPEIAKTIEKRRREENQDTYEGLDRK